jgi:TetR/AcrR family transcriptional regulator, cholesterol catabolism regulator
MNTLTRRQRTRRDKQQRIVAAAKNLFRTQGFDATTTEQIAARADVAKGTVFLYAPTKLQLLALVYEDELAARVEKAFIALSTEAPVIDALVALFWPFFQLYEQDLALARLFVREQLFADLPARPAETALGALLQQLAAQISTWQLDKRIVADIDPMLAAQNTFALYFAVLVAWLQERLPHEQRDTRLRASLDLYWRGLVIPKTATPR